MKNLDIKLKVGDSFFTLDGINLVEGKVDKIEIYEDYFRYVNEDDKCLTNWFVNEQIDNDFEVWPEDGATQRIFTSKEKALDSFDYKRNRKSYVKEQIEKLTEELRQLEDWNENVEYCDGCGIHWKKIGKQCPVCYSWSEHDREMISEGKKRSDRDTRRGI